MPNVEMKLCRTCNKEFKKLETTSRRRWEIQQFCSIPCSNTLIRKGGSLHVKQGWEKMYLTQRQQKRKGVLNGMWKGGTSWPFLKSCALFRDNWTCGSCGLREPQIMEVDHIKKKSEYPELARSLENLMTLCPNCHRRKTNKELLDRTQSVTKQLGLLCEVKAVGF